MRKIVGLVLLFVAACSFLQAQPGEQSGVYDFTIDLAHVSDDKVNVELRPPADALLQDDIVYHMPSIVPGTYEIYDFGRFVSAFKALDKDGKELKVTALDVNSWKIYEARKLARISYRVEDTWDAKMDGERVFEPGGTNIERDTNFVINTHGFCGYFEGLKRRRYELTFIRPDGFFGATSMSSLQSMAKDRDRFASDNYMDLVDSPIMYCKPDTAHVHVGGCDVLISVYSPHQLITAKFVADELHELLGFQQAYLGGTLPVNRYTFLVYLSPDGYLSGSMGALEHSYSSMYCLPEMMPVYIGPRLRDFAAHEFFHIVTPLSIHSEEIGEFDYNVPKMSEHLWLYEGLTEYAAGLVQVKYGKMTFDQYVNLIAGKMQGTMRYKNDLSFTEMSKGVLDKYKDQYGNVYQKGALIGLCLDIKLRKLSGGKYGVQELMRDLAKDYGKDKSFKDDELIPKIVSLTYPEIGEFFKNCVEGGQPLPYKEVLADVGIDYKAKQNEKKMSAFGGLSMIVDEETSELILVDLGNTNDFAAEMGYQDGDIVKTFNGTAINKNNALEVVKSFVDNAHTGSKIKVEISRKKDDGNMERKTLKGKMHFVETVREHVVTPMDKPTEEQLALRKAWIDK